MIAEPVPIRTWGWSRGGGHSIQVHSRGDGRAPDSSMTSPGMEETRRFRPPGSSAKARARRNFPTGDGFHHSALPFKTGKFAPWALPTAIRGGCAGGSRNIGTRSLST